MLSMNAGAAPPPSMFPLAPPPAFQSIPAPADSRLPPPPPHAMSLQIRPVTEANYAAELDLIAALLPRYPVVAIDTEYPGTVHRPPPGTRGDRSQQLSPPERYALVKANADELPVVQLGITLCDEFGNVPAVVVGGDDGRRLFELAWEVTFSDFDPRRDRHAPDSVAFLRSRGVDFDLARSSGVSSPSFAAKLAAVLSSTRVELTWAAFGGAHDFAYMVKMLSGGQPLPATWHEFMAAARVLLGGRVFDAKYMAEHCERADLCGGGLRRVAGILHMQARNLPAEPPACFAGRKSHSACRVFTAMRRRVLYRDGGACLEGLMDGLHN